MHARDAITVYWVSRSLEERDDPRPLFLFVNLIGAHPPFDSCGSSCGSFGEDLDGQPATHGRNLLISDPAPRNVLTEYYRPDQAMLRLFPDGGGQDDQRVRTYWRRIRTVGRDGWKLIWGSDGNHELYDLVNDPAETHDLIESPEAVEMRDPLLGELEDLIVLYGDRASLFGEDADASASNPNQRKHGALDRDSLDVETREELRALGYIE